MAEKYEIAHRIEHSPSYALLILSLKPDQSVLVEASSMSAMDSHLTLKSQVKGGWLQGLSGMLGGESLFMSEFTAKGQKGELYIAPGIPGDIKHYYLKPDRGLMLQSSAFVACSPGVEIDSQFQGMKGFFSGESLFLLRAMGEGDLWFNSYGGIIEVSVSGDHVVDTGYIVAFEDSLDYQVEMIKGLSFKGLAKGILGGEGLICRFQGQGKLWIQCRQLSGLLNFLAPYRPSREK